MIPSPGPTRQIRLTGRASRLLMMMTDFGHLDTAGVDSVLMVLSDRYGSAHKPSLVDIAQVRPVVAAVLADTADLENGALAEDWGPLFH